MLLDGLWFVGECKVGGKEHEGLIRGGMGEPFVFWSHENKEHAVVYKLSRFFVPRRETRSLWSVSMVTGLPRMWLENSQAQVIVKVFFYLCIQLLSVHHGSGHVCNWSPL